MASARLPLSEMQSLHVLLDLPAESKTHEQASKEDCEIYVLQ